MNMLFEHEQYVANGKISGHSGSWFQISPENTVHSGAGLHFGHRDSADR